MNKLQAFWYLSEAFLLALYISFLAIISNSIWFGVIGGCLIMGLRHLTNKALNKIKVKK